MPYKKNIREEELKNKIRERKVVFLRLKFGWNFRKST